MTRQQNELQGEEHSEKSEQKEAYDKFKQKDHDREKEQRKLLRTKAMMNLDLLKEIRAKKTKQMAEYRAKKRKVLLETDILPDNTCCIAAKKAKKEQKQHED